MAGLGGKFRVLLYKFVEALNCRLQRLYDRSLFRLAHWNRSRLTNTVFVAVTGSAGKTTAKDLITCILQRHFFKGTKTPDTSNYPEDIARVLLGTRQSDAYCVTEISAHGGPGKLDMPVALMRPSVGVVTNIGTDHVSAYRSQEAIAAEKSKLIRALPVDGIAILNANDPLVMAMAAQ